MAKFSSRKPVVKSPVRTTGKRISTYEGHLGYERDAKSELFMLAAVNMVGENTFYESAKDRDQRFENLVRAVAVEDPDWIARFVPYLRNEMFMRSASLVMAAEFARANSQEGLGYDARKVVNSALARPDEPGEMLAYWLSTYGRPIPMAIKRGVADAAIRMYTPWNAIKYDGVRQPWRPADVINLLHPTPKDEEQERVFKWLLDRRYGNVQAEGSYMDVDMIAGYEWLYTMPQEERYDYLLKAPFEAFKNAGMTWERISEWAGKLDAKVWEKIIPSMGYMALLRNLRNFDQADISKESVKYVQNKLSDPDEVAKSKQFPFRFLSAWKAVKGMTWATALEEALDYSTQNIPEFPGTTLVLADMSGSMMGAISGKSDIMRYEVAAVFATAMAKKGNDVQLVLYDTKWETEDVKKGGSVLRAVEKMHRDIGYGGRFGGGTSTFQALRANYSGHDRVVIVTDEQAHPYYGSDPTSGIKAPIYTFNVAGYRAAHLPSGGKEKNYAFGGFSDAAFKMIPLLERGRSADWPF